MLGLKIQEPAFWVLLGREVIIMSMSISGINSNAYNSYDASLTKSVASDPAGSVIAQEQLAQINGYNQGSKNGETGQDLIATADGALSGISDSLQRMRELSVQASSSAIYSDDDRKMIQKEIDQLKSHITDIAKNTQFNTKNLLDGSLADLHLALNPQGGGLSIHTTNATLEALGIADYDVTGKFDISKLDDAIKKVSDARSSLGAQSSALSYSIGVSNLSSENLTSSFSNLSDVDIQDYVSNKKKDEVMKQYQYFVFNQQVQEKENMISKMLGM